MPFSIPGLLLALLAAGIVYAFPIFKLKKKGEPIPFTPRNIMNAVLIVGGGYFIFTGLLGLIK